MKKVKAIILYAAWYFLFFSVYDWELSGKNAITAICLAFLTAFVAGPLVKTLVPKAVEKLNIR